MNNYLWIGTLLCIVSIVSNQNVTVTYVEDGVSLYRGSGLSSGCYLNLGCFPYWCLGNISLCQAGFSLTFWIKAYSDVSPDLDPQVLLTSGGHRTNNEGFYIVRRYSDQYTVGVTLGDKHWKTTVRLASGTPALLAISWARSEGLALYVDGLYQSETKEGENRTGVIVPDGSSACVVLGQSEYYDQLTGPCTLEVSDIILTNSKDTVYGFESDIDVTQRLYLGCAAFNVNSPAILTDSDRADPGSFCRLRCSQLSQVYALVSNGSKCGCTNSVGVTNTTQCDGKWSVYLVSHVKVSHNYQLTLEWTPQSKRNYTKPFEDIVFNTSVGYNVKVVYKFTFDDGIIITTSTPPVSHSWMTPGQHTLTVSAQIGVVKLNASVVVNVQDVDEGQPPDLIGLTVTHGQSSFNAQCNLTVIDDLSSNCVLSYGNGKTSPTFYLQENGSFTFPSHTYDMAGLYSISANCINAYGHKSAMVSFVSRDLRTLHEYVTPLRNYSTLLFGDQSFFNRLEVSINNEKVSFFLADAKTLQVNAGDMHDASDNLIDVVSEGVLLHRHIVYVRSVLDKPVLIADKTAGAWNLTVKLTVLLNSADHVWLTIDYGTKSAGSVKTFYVPEITGMLRVDDTMFYGNLGEYVITVTASNEVSSSRSQMDISVQIPVFDISVRTRNITSPQQNAAFELRVNSGQVIAEDIFINIGIKYGDGAADQFIFKMSDRNYLGSLVANHTYATWGIYRVKVSAMNNISQDEDQTLIQVGENITFVDITATSDRVTVGGNLEVSVVCPTGSNVQYRLDFGDGSVFTFGELNTSYQVVNSSNVVTISETSAVVSHVYSRAGSYKVKVTVSNEFGFMSADLCPAIVVSENTMQTCSTPTMTFRNIQTSADKPLVRKRSVTTLIPVDVVFTCSDNIKPNVTFSWKGVVIENIGVGKVVERSLYTFCSSKLLDNTLKIDPLALQFGLYKLTATVSPMGNDLSYTSDSVYINIVQSEPVPSIAGDPVQTIMLYATAIFDISGSYDPDLETDTRRDLSFHLFFMSESLLKVNQKLSLNSLVAQAELLANRTLFRSTTANRFSLYQIGSCFNSTSRLNDDLSTFLGKITFAANNFASNQFSMAVMLWVERNGLSAMTYQIIEIRSSNASLDDLGSLLDLAKTADPDTAIRLLGGAASAILHQDTSSAEAQQKLAESTEAVVNTLGSVAKRIDSPNQAAKCASAIKTMTSNQDIVNEGSRSSAAGAFMVLANGTSNMPEATVEDASSFAGECLGGLGNIFPKSPTTKPGQTVLTADETTTALLITLTTTRPGTTLAFSGNLTTPFSLVDSRNNASSYSTKSVTSPTAGLYQDTKATPMPTTTMTTVMTTPLTTVIHTTVGTTLSPTVGASFADNGDNFTISGVTVGTLQLNASKDYTTPQPFTTSTIGTTTPSTPESPVTLPIDNRMFEPRSDPRSPSQIAQELLRNLPDKDTYRELFFYIFSDCLLFRQVMKSPEIQYNIPCLSTDAINMMKCDGDFTLQDRVFDIMTYYEHPDDIYEVYLQPLDKAGEARDKARKETDKTVANAGLTALSTVADSIGNKTHPEDTTERSFATPRLGMKLAKVSVDNSTNITDSSNNTQTMSLPTGGFDVPKSIFQGSASGCANVNTMFLADSDNPFTFADTDNNVGRGVLSLAYTCNGERINVSGTQEPIVLWMERDANMYQESLFVLITNTKTDVWSNFNYHPVNLTETNSSLQVILEPQDADSEYYVYLKFGERPNVTYYDYIGFSPNDEVTKLSGYQSLNDSQKQQLRYTVTFPLDLTSSNGTYWIAVKYKRGNIQLADTTANSSYTLLNLVSGCRFWDDENNTWASEGCQVGPLTTKYRTQCLCNHLTSFGTDAVVAPNTIDFTNVWAKFDKLSENAAVFATVISLVCLYLILLIILRYFDKLDLIKWGAIPLEDNLPTDSYFYQVTVQTGVKRNAGTDSQVRFIVSGEEGDSGVRRLTVAEGKRKHLATGSIYNYVMSVDSCLGPLNFLRIWHDNSGKGKNQSWYLDQVQINDLQTGERFIFLCDRWLAVEEDDGLVDRILPVAGLDDLIAFKQLFSSSARKKLANDHLWVSVFSRPTRSNFTRVQRLSCCMSLLFLTMITNAMWFKGAETQTNVEAIKIGPLTFTLAQVFISFASTIIVFPPSFLMMTLFRKCEPKKNMVAQANQAHVKDSRKFRWRNISASTSQLWGSKPKESRMVQFKEKITQFINSFKKRKYQDVEPASSDRSDGQFLTPKKKKPFTFPHWCIYIAWTLCFLSILVSGFFTILYSMEWGTEKANQWLTTFLLSFFESVIIVQPIKVLLLVAFIACILKKPELEDEDLDEDINRVLVGKETADSKDEASLSQIMLQRRTDNSELQPPDPELLAKLRETRMMEIKMETVLKEIIVYMIFLVIIFFLSYQQRDPQSYAYNTNVRGVLLDKFDKIVTIQDYWTWLQENFLPAFYAQQYADGNDVRYWRDVACIADMESRRVGVARIRQLRIKNDTCSIQSELKSVINHCRDSYGWTADDTKPYLPFWETPADDMKKELEMSKSPFVYQDSIDLKTAPFVGNIATYKGGGYVILTKRTYGRTAAIVDKAKSENWVDLNTKAIFLEYTIYNPNVNLFTSVTALVEFLPTGSAVTMADVKVFRLMSYIGGFGVIVLVFEIFFGIVSIIFFVQCIKKVRVQRIAYFADFWNILEFVLLCLAVTCIVLYGFKHVLTDVAISALQNRKSDGFVNFNTIALYDELYGFVMSAVVFLATIQFLKLLQFNKKMGMLGATVKLASKDLYLFSITFFLYFFAFTATGFLLFCSQLTSYQNVVSTAEAMFAFALGSFDFNELSAAQPFWGPLFVFAYIGVVYIGLMSIFLTIIGESFSQVKENVALQSNDYELVEFIWTKIKVLFK